MEIIALIVTIIIFIISTVINNFGIIDDRKKRWYVEIIVNQNLNPINSFFKESLKIFSESKEVLKKEFSDKNDVKYLEKKATYVKKISDLQSKFHFEVIPFFNSYDSKITKNLRDILEEYQDYYAEHIGLESVKRNKIIKTELEDIKQRFYKRLYQPVKNTFFNNVRLERILLIILICFFITVFCYSKI